MQYQQTPQGLGDLYNLPIAAQPQAMALLSQQQNADQMTQQDQQRQLNYDTANDPLKLQEKDLANQTTAAELPWHQAKASMLQRANQNEGTTNDAHIQDILGKYKSADLERHVKDVEDLGQIAQQQYQGIYMEPFGGAARAQKAFQDAGHGDMWNPEWNDLPAGELASKLKDFGDGIQSMSSKFRIAMGVQQSKADAIKYAADQRLEGARVAAEQRAQAAAALVAQRTVAAATPKSLSDWAAKMQQIAVNEPDPVQAAKYQAQADKALQDAKDQAAAAATVNTAPKVDTSTMGVPNMADRKGGTPTPTMAGAQQPPTTSTPTAAAGWPQGAVQNPDGSVTFNGKTYRKKQ